MIREKKMGRGNIMQLCYVNDNVTVGRLMGLDRL